MNTIRLALVMSVACAVALCAPARTVKAEGSILFGNQFWTQNAPEAKYQEFRDVPRGPFLQALDLEKWSGKDMFAVTAVNALHEDQGWRAVWASGARFSVRLGYIGTPHRFALNSTTPYTEIRPGVFVLPDSLQALIQRSSSGGVTNILTNAVANGHLAPLGFQTSTASGRVRVRPAKGWTFDISGKQIMRTGNKAIGTIIGTSPGSPMVELYEPINQLMTDGGVRADYQSDRVTVQVNGNFSLFDNKYDRLTWDNSRRLVDSPTAGGGTGQLALAPDNTEVRGSVAAGIKLPQQTLFSATVGVGRITQKQDWLPLTTNLALRPDTIRVPGTNTEGKADVVNLDARLTNMSMRSVRTTLRFHEDRYENGTPEWLFPHNVNGDVSVAGPFESKPFSNSNWVGGFDLDGDLGSRASAGVTAEYRERDRTFREVAKDKETVIGGRLRLRPANGISIDGRVRYGDRKLDEFNLEDYEGAEQPDLRRYDVASRKQTQGSGGITWSPLEAFDVSATYTYLKNDYTDLRFGLTGDQSQVISSMGTIHASPRLDLRGGYGFSQTKTDQASKQALSGVLPIDAASDSLLWYANIKDENVFVNAGFDLWLKPDKFSIVADYEFSRDHVIFDLVAGPGFTSPFLSASNQFGGTVPPTLYRRHDLTVEARYRVMKDTDVSARYMWEEFDAIDFATVGVAQVAPSAAAIYLGDFYQNYRAHALALMVRHSF